MPQIEVSWDYTLILEWSDGEGVLCVGPEFEDVLPGSLLRRIYAWVDEMNEVYGWMGEDESVEVPEVVASGDPGARISCDAPRRMVGPCC